MSYQAPSFNGGSEASAFTSRNGSTESPRPDATPVTPSGSHNMDAATATLIGQLVATDMARQDHKDKATASTAAVVVKQRPPPPHRTNSNSQHSRNSRAHPASPISLSQHLQRTSVPLSAAAAHMSASTVTHTTASPPPRSLRSTESGDRKPAALVTPARLLMSQGEAVHDEDDSPKSHRSPYRNPLPLGTASGHSARLVSPSAAANRAYGPVPTHGAAKPLPAPPLTHDRMMEEKRRARSDAAVVVTPRQKYLREAGQAFAADGGDTAAARPNVAASDDALQQAKRRERERGPTILQTVVRRTPSRNHSTQSTPSALAPTNPTLAAPNAAPSPAQDDALQQAKRQERERGPALAAANVVRRTPSRHHSAQSTPSVPPQGPPAPKADADDALQHAKRQERERGPTLLTANTARRSRTGRPSAQGATPGAVPHANPPPVRSTLAAADEKQPYRVATSSAQPKDDDDDASTDSAYALAMARSHLQDKLRSEASAGPSLATATGAAEVHPGAVAFVGQELHRKNAVAVEAHAGVPVPGAFAVQGISSPHDDDSVDSDIEDDPSEIYVDRLVDLENPSATTTPALDTITPLEAEVYEQVVVDGAIADTDDDEETLDPKTVRRLRTVQLSILGVALLAVGIIIGTILGFASRGGNGNGPPPVIGWKPVGSTLFGSNTETPQTLFGSALALSADGQRLAVAAPGTDNGTALNVGTVYLLEAYQDENGTNWRTLETLAGPGPSNEAHTAVALAEQTLAVGYSRFTQGRPVQIFESESLLSGEEDEESTWQASMSVPMWNASEDAWWGYAVDLSGDGTILAVGAPRMNGPYGVSSGVVQVFQQQQRSEGNVTWVPMGTSLYGTSVDEFFGWTLSLSAGPRLAVGAPVYNDTSGLVRLYDWNGENQEWVPAGDLRGDVPLGRFGESVALSGNDGTVLAVGARGSAFDEGQVMVYREQNGQWVLDDATLLQGEEIGEGFGASVALSLDGGTLAVGAPQSNYFGKDTGAISVYRYSADQLSWKQHGSAIGSPAVSEFGASVTLSDDGLRVAGGAPTTAYDGSVSRAGCVLVYDLVELSKRVLHV